MFGEYLSLSNFTYILINIIFLLLALWILKLQHHHSGYPPGPLNLPIIGNLIQIVLAGSVRKFLQKSRKVFGNVYTIDFGGQRTVIVSGYKNVYKLLVKEADICSNRPPPPTIGSYTVSPGLVFATYPHWKTLRSFALNVLRDEGMGKQELEPSILLEIESYCDRFIEPVLGRPTCLFGSLNKATNNVISGMIFGGRSDYEDVAFHRMVDSASTLVRNNQRGLLTRNIPFAKYISSNQAFEQGSKMLKNEMVKRLEEVNTNKCASNSIFSEYLNHCKELKDTPAAFTDDNIVAMGVQLYAAGTETTSTALLWALYYTCCYPDMMARVQQEIDSIIGCEVGVRFTDRISMPYTDAFLFETLRCSHMVSTSAPRKLEKDITVEGLVIHEGSTILFDLDSTLHDSAVFDDPELFNPERYLTGDTKLKKQRTIPFSLGRRACLGERLARMELFLFYVTLLQKYDVRFPVGEIPAVKPMITSVFPPPPYKIMFMKRTL